MDLIPRPEQVVSAAADVARRLLRGARLGRLDVCAARRTAWTVVAERVARRPPEPVGRRSAGRRAASPAAIGANPDRRYGSAASRTLARN
jgi:polyhydroxyalkanoate synthase